MWGKLCCYLGRKCFFQVVVSSGEQALDILVGHGSFALQILVDILVGYSAQSQGAEEQDPVPPRSGLMIRGLHCCFRLVVLVMLVLSFVLSAGACNLQPLLY